MVPELGTSWQLKTLATEACLAVSGLGAVLRLPGVLWLPGEQTCPEQLFPILPSSSPKQKLYPSCNYHDLIQIYFLFNMIQMHLLFIMFIID